MEANGLGFSVLTRDTLTCDMWTGIAVNREAYNQPWGSYTTVLPAELWSPRLYCGQAVLVVV